jgi:hypothetical protein
MVTEFIEVSSMPNYDFLDSLMKDNIKNFIGFNRNLILAKALFLSYIFPMLKHTAIQK